MRHPASLCYALGKMDEKNKLYFGDNLRILREYVPDASVDLIYLDPACGRQAAVQFQRHVQRALQGKERRRIRRADHGLRGHLAVGPGTCLPQAGRKPCTRKSSPAARASSPTSCSRCEADLLQIHYGLLTPAIFRDATHAKHGGRRRFYVMLTGRGLKQVSPNKS